MNYCVVSDLVLHLKIDMAAKRCPLVKADLIGSFQTSDNAAAVHKKYPDTSEKYPDTFEKYPYTCSKYPDTYAKYPDTFAKYRDTFHKYPYTCQMYRDSS